LQEAEVLQEGIRHNFMGQAQVVHLEEFHWAVMGMLPFHQE
jgi:hypothetical protein